MTFANDDLCTPAALFPYGGTAAENLASGLILDGPPLLGVISDFTGVDLAWNNGTQESGYPATALRFVDQAAAATVQDLVGRMVRLANSSQEFSGLVVSVFALEAATTGKTGDGAVVTTEVVLLRTRSGQFVLAAAASVSVLTGQ